MLSRSLPEVSETDDLEEDELYDEFDSGQVGNDCCGCNDNSGNWQQTSGNWSHSAGNSADNSGNFSGKLLLDDLLMINHDREPHLYDIRKTFGFSDPFPLPCADFPLVFTVTLTQPPLLHLLFWSPLPTLPL